MEYLIKEYDYSDMEDEVLFLKQMANSGWEFISIIRTFGISRYYFKKITK